jgi:hypothetical protein
MSQPSLARTASKTLFVFSSSESVEELAVCCAAYFYVNKSQMPRIHARAIMLLEEDRLIKSSALNNWEMIQYAHGGNTTVEYHVHF